MENGVSYILIENFIDNGMILKCLESLKESGSFKNKLWNMFLYGDGSMTKNLKFLFPNLKLEIVSKNMINNRNNDEKNFKEISGENILKSDEEFISIEVLKKLKELMNFEILSENIIERKIIFYTEENFLREDSKSEKSLKMVGLSFWDEEFYRKLYPNSEDENKPIGLIMIEKEIEFFKSIKNFIYETPENKIIFRISTFKINKQTAFVLIEIFVDKALLENFGELK